MGYTPLAFGQITKDINHSPSSVNRFFRDTGTLLTGNVIAQGIAFAAYLLLGRLYTPDDFGTYTIFYGYIEILIILSTCKYELAIVVADNDSEAARIARLTLRLNTLLSLVLLTIALLLSLTAVSLSSLPPQLYLLIPPMVFFCGTTRVYTFLFNRYQNYSPIAANEVVTSLSGTATKIFFGFLSGIMPLLHTIGLPLGTILGKMIGNTYYRHQLNKSQIPLPSAGNRLSNTKELIKKHRNFPLFSTPKELVSSLSANLPFLWLGIYFDNKLIGLFGLALTFTMRPLNLLTNAFEKVFYATSNEQVSQRKSLQNDIRKFEWILNGVAIPILIVGFFFAEPIFTFLFGDKWIGTGLYVRYIIPWLWVLLNANSLAFIANIFSTQRIDFFFQLVQLILRIAALWTGIRRGNFQAAIFLFCMASTAVQLAQWVWYLVQLHRYEKKITVR